MSVVVLAVSVSACSRSSDANSSGRAVISVETEIPTAQVVSLGLSTSSVPIEQFRMAPEANSTSLLVASDGSGRQVGLGLVPVSDVIPTSQLNSISRVDHSTTALTINVFQSGVSDPLIVTLVAGLLADTPELAEASRSIGDALEDPAVDVFSLPTDVLVQIQGLSSVALQRAERLLDEAPRSQVQSLRSQSSRTVSNECLEDSRIRVDSGVCIQTIEETSEGVFELSGFNETPRWLFAKATDFDGPRSAALIPPRVTQVPDALGLLKDLVFDIGGTGATLLKKGIGAFGRSLGFNSSLGADDPSVRERMLERLEQYAGPQKFSVRLATGDSRQAVLLAGLASQSESMGVDTSLLAVTDYLTVIQTVILPVLSILSGGSSFLDTHSKDGVWSWQAPDDGIEVLSSAFLAGIQLKSVMADLLKGNFADFIGAIPALATDLVILFRDPDTQRFVLDLWGVDPKQLAQAQLENFGRVLEFSPIKVVETGIDVVNAASTLWSLFSTKDRVRSVTLFQVSQPTGLPVATTTPTSMTEVPADLLARVESCRVYVSDIEGNGNHYPCQEGPWVKRLQSALVEWKVLAESDVSGRFDEATQIAILRWQTERGWPNPWTQIDKDEILGVMIFSILDETNISLTDTCPYWFDADERDVDPLPPNGTGPVLGLCHAGDRVDYLQSVLARDGFLDVENGRFDLATYMALLEYERRNGLGVDGRIDKDEFWYIFGD